ncbi:unnamed protein product [Caenorhabditis nigoni]|nr:hypothetical protein B9Z55_028140 [Caenorhabditis nigoni]
MPVGHPSGYQPLGIWFHNRRWVTGCRMAPIARIRIEMKYERYGLNAKAFVNRTPFESTETIDSYEMIDNRLMPIGTEGDIPNSPDEYDEDYVEPYTVTVDTWTRRQSIGPAPRPCNCHLSYETRDQRHDNPFTCMARILGQDITERIWANRPITELSPFIPSSFNFDRYTQTKPPNALRDQELLTDVYSAFTSGICRDVLNQIPGCARSKAADALRRLETEH